MTFYQTIIMYYYYIYLYNIILWALKLDYNIISADWKKKYTQIDWCQHVYINKNIITF